MLRRHTYTYKEIYVIMVKKHMMGPAYTTNVINLLNITYILISSARL